MRRIGSLFLSTVLLVVLFWFIASPVSGQDDDSEHLAEARIALQNKDWQGAASALAKISARNRTNPMVAYYGAQAAEGAGLMPQAIFLYKAYAAIVPSPEITDKIAQLQYQMDKKNRAFGPDIFPTRWRQQASTTGACTDCNRYVMFTKNGHNYVAQYWIQGEGQVPEERKEAYIRDYQWDGSAFVWTRVVNRQLWQQHCASEMPPSKTAIQPDPDNHGTFLMIETLPDTATCQQGKPFTTVLVREREEGK